MHQGGQGSGAQRRPAGSNGQVSLFAPLKQEMPCANRTAGDVPVRQRKNKWKCCCRCFCLTFAAPLGPGRVGGLRAAGKTAAVEQFEQKCFTVPVRLYDFSFYGSSGHVARRTAGYSPRRAARQSGFIIEEAQERNK